MRTNAAKHSQQLNYKLDRDSFKANVNKLCIKCILLKARHMA